MGFGDFMKRMFGGGQTAADEGQAQTSSPVAPAPATPAPTPAPSTATPGAGGTRASPAAGLGVSDERLDAIHGAFTGGHTGDKLDPRQLELLADREKAQAELKDRFQIMSPEQLKALGDKALPNQISQEQLQKLATTFSDIRMGESNLKLDTAGMPKDKAEEFQKGAMGDIASMLQTGSGRDLIAQLDVGLGKDGKEHTTTIGNTNPRAAMAEAADPASEALRQTTGTDMVAKYRPGADVAIGDPAKEPWWPQRSDVTLFHELTHALHGVQGTTQKFESPDFADVMKHKVADMPTPTLMEEWSTVGLGPHANDPITENKYREERRKMAGNPGARPGDEATSMARREQYASWS